MVTFIVKDQDGKEVKWFTENTNEGPSCWILDISEKNIHELKITPVITVYNRIKTGPHESIDKNDYTKALEDQSFEVKVID